MTPIKKSLILLAAATAFSCSDKQAQQQQNSVDDMQAIELQEPSISNTLDAKAIEKIQTFYTNYIFGDEFANDSVIAKYCTKSLALMLSKAYDDEYSDGGGYAVWKFRSDAQDGEDIHEVEKIEPLGNGKYLIHYNDMGNKGTHTITIVQQEVEKIEPLGNGKYLIHYNDMGNKGTHTITIVQQDGEIFFDKLD